MTVIIFQGSNDGEIFRNRKGFFSLNVQVTCDADMKFIDVVARWPGSAHDATIFMNSLLRARFEAQEFPNCVLLGMIIIYYTKDVSRILKHFCGIFINSAFYR